MKTVLLASPNPPGCPQSPITNNSKIAKGEMKCQIKKIVIRNIAIRRSPLHRSRNR